MRMTYWTYSELIFTGCEIAGFAERGEYSEAIALIRGLNSLQSAYAFRYAIQNCEEVNLKLLMDFIERVMNEGEVS